MTLPLQWVDQVQAGALSHGSGAPVAPPVPNFSWASYLDDATGDIYVWNDSAWIKVSTLPGASGGGGGGSSVGVDNFAPVIVPIPTTAGGTTLVAARAGRLGVILENLGTDTVYMGQGVITASMYPLYPNGERIWLPLKGALKGLAASGTQNVLTAELY